MKFRETWQTLKTWNTKEIEITRKSEGTAFQKYKICWVLTVNKISQSFLNEKNLFSYLFQIEGSKIVEDMCFDEILTSSEPRQPFAFCVQNSLIILNHVS